eukprot:6182652-Pleurochrysis_carterae.AAC.3
MRALISEKPAARLGALARRRRVTSSTCRLYSSAKLASWRFEIASPYSSLPAYECVLTLCPFPYSSHLWPLHCCFLP